MYERDPAHFLSAPGLAWQACLKKTGVKLELSANNDMLVMIEKGIRGVEYVMQYIFLPKQIISIRKIIIKTLNHYAQCI